MRDLYVVCTNALKAKIPPKTQTFLIGMTIYNNVKIMLTKHESDDLEIGKNIGEYISALSKIWEI